MKRILVMLWAVAVLLNANAQECIGNYAPDGDEMPCGDLAFPCCTVYDACNGWFSGFANYDPDFSSSGGCNLACTSGDYCSTTFSLAFYSEYILTNPLTGEDGYSVGPGYHLDHSDFPYSSDFDIYVGDTLGLVNHYGSSTVTISSGGMIWEAVASVVEIEDCPQCVSTYVFEEAGAYSISISGTDIVIDVVVNPVPIGGCLDESACNYNADATYSDDSCDYADPGYDCDGNCQIQPDVNCDGYVNVNDLLGLLGYFGDEDLDGDGVWDSQDDCIEDECGVCDGPGPEVLAVDTITFTVDSIYVEAINEWYVFEIPDTSFTYVCSNPGCTDPTADNYDPYASENDGTCIGGSPCGSQLTVIFDGYDYDTVEIGGQCWFAENLRTEHFANGDAIPANLSDNEWASTASGAVAVYGEDTGCEDFSPDGDACDPAWSLNEYGRLYNWYAVDDERGLCPTGWHVPTDGEWSVLTDYLGGSEVAGNEMKTTYGWYGEGNGTNSSGFSGLPGGFRSQSTYFNGAGVSGIWWSSSPSGSYAWFRVVDNVNTNVGRDYSNLQGGLSVRCLKDD